METDNIKSNTVEILDSTSEQCDNKNNKEGEDDKKDNNKNNCTECSYRGELTKFTNFCEECQEQLCDDCTNIHKTRKTTRSHSVINKLASGNTSPGVNNTWPSTDRSILIESSQNKTLDVAEFSPNKIPNTPSTIHLNAAGWPSSSKSDEEEQSSTVAQWHHGDTDTCSESVSELKTSNVTDTLSPFSRTNTTLATSITCNVCSDKGNNIPASRYCSECEETLCEVCVGEHKRRKATSKHALNDIQLSNLPRKKEICDACHYEGKDSVAVMICGVCEEKLCKPCTEQHRKRKATQTHKLTDLSMINTATPPKPMCDVCLEENENHAAVLFCDVCDEHLCQPCVDKHRKRKATASHSLMSPAADSLPSYIDDNGNTPYCSPCESLKKRTPATIFCIDCDQFFCAFCSNQHMISKISINHEAIPAEQIKKHTQNLECDCCKLMLKSKTATRYCQDCESKLCEKCSCQHNFFPTTKNHVLVRGFEMVTKIIAKLGRCAPCQQSNNLKFGDSVCIECKLVLCKTCVSLHSKQKSTEFHTLISIDNIAKETRSDHLKDNVGSKTNLCDKCPSMPKHLDVSTSSITLTWQKPATTSGTIINYDIRFKEEGEPKWRMRSTEKEHETETIADLKCDTPYQFKVRAVYADEDGPDSPVSEVIRTNISLARNVIGQSVAVPTQQKPNEPKIYKIPIRERRNCRNEMAKTRKCVFGTRTPGTPEKTIMVIGATGAGKSTLIDGMVNYILDVSWEDDFRFTTIDLMEDEKNKDQTKSQTEWITSYTINLTQGSQIYYTLNIIDTPGFGDTRGIERDHQIVDQIRELFNTSGDQGVASLDAVCFVTQAPLARLSATQRYIIDSILSIFGCDITGNIFALITFADGKTPPVLEALKTADVPIVGHFVFNNSALFAQNQNVSESSFSPMFWKMGKLSFKTFFKYLNNVEARSLQLTSEVLNERKQLETLVKGLRPQIDEGLHKLETLRQESSILKQHQADIANNRNFTYEVDEPCTKRIELDPGIHVTNCLTCNRTCHDRCAYADDKDKIHCSAMAGDGYCEVCPGGCIWSQHANNPYKYEYYMEKKRGTYEELKRKYEDALGGASKQKSVIQAIKDEFNQLSRKVGTMVERMRRSINRLSEIALKPNPLSDVQYIDLIIESEMQEMKPGFQGRVTMLTQLRKDAELVQNLPTGEFKPFGDIDLEDIVETEEKPKGIVSKIKGMFKF